MRLYNETGTEVKIKIADCRVCFRDIFGKDMISLSKIKSIN